ncbi:DUF934 domain-containing protein [Methylobrevis pamukkalensis]|uniref:Oxidoreductase n=1 Tax=Methylobrevis pamukkalensis TaxID=1439726 RepID=A0A1E3GYD3_9HYPH|nr:DUF934 domain-containing protein [Methylobrevis pamukkalensis]ODN69068.1 hypothetical protein A6302_03635 [Methylobrevis pamukkalensis]
MTAIPTISEPKAVSAATPSATDVYRDGAFVADDWRHLVSDEEIPAEGRVFLSLTRFLAEAEALAGDNRAIGVRIEPGEKVADLVPYLDRLPAIALVFPKFVDGRAYSQATLLRDKYGFAADLRAVGDVLIDQIGYMRRVGFTTFEIRNEPTRRALESGRDPEVKRYYQPAFRKEPPAGTRPWMRRAED